MNANGRFWWQIIIGSGRPNGLVPSVGLSGLVWSQLFKHARIEMPVDIGYLLRSSTNGFNVDLVCFCLSFTVKIRCNLINMQLAMGWMIDRTVHHPQGWQWQMLGKDNAFRKQQELVWYREVSNTRVMRLELSDAARNWQAFLSHYCLRRLSKLEVMQSLYCPISRLRDFSRYYNETPYVTQNLWNNSSTDHFVILLQQKSVHS